MTADRSWRCWQMTVRRWALLLMMAAPLGLLVWRVSDVPRWSRLAAGGTGAVLGVAVILGLLSTWPHKSLEEHHALDP